MKGVPPRIIANQLGERNFRIEDLRAGGEITVVQKKKNVNRAG